MQADDDSADSKGEHDRGSSLIGSKHGFACVAAAAALAFALGAAACATGGSTAPEPPTVTSTATSTATSTPVPTPTPRPDPLALGNVKPGLADLQARLQQAIDDFARQRGGNFAVAVTDLQNGQTIHVNGDSIRIPGCTMNFFVLLQVVKDLQEGRYPENEVGAKIARTVWASDAAMAHILLRKSGGENTVGGLWKVNTLLHHDLQLPSAVFNHPPAVDNFTLEPGKWVDNAITPLDFNRALTLLYRGELLTPEWTMYLINKMSSVKPGLNHLIPSGVGGPLAYTAHKNGYIDYKPYIVDNDVGFVFFKRNGKQYAYALTFWSQDNPWVLSDAPLGHTVSKLVWDHFNATYT